MSLLMAELCWCISAIFLSGTFGPLISICT